MQYITTFFHKWEKVVEKIYELEFLSPNRKGDQSLGYRECRSVEVTNRLISHAERQFSKLWQILPSERGMRSVPESPYTVFAEQHCLSNLKL